MRILLAVDDREVAEYVRRDLEDEGHSVLVCYDGADALRAAQLHAFDMIILGVMMVFIDGLALTSRLRREGIRTPILLLTAPDAPDEIPELLPLDAEPLLRDVADQAATMGADKGIDVRLEVEGEALPVRGQEASLRRLLLILVDNAVKFTPAGALSC